ncbi:MAG: hypothetical protein K0S01_2437 [Herbinix sp.]|jgi:hypothetical protein|nr:hypothetical protein [Herbinix sp.]
MERNTIIRHMNNAIEMKEEINKSHMMYLVYKDFDFDKFIDQCRELLSDCWDDATYMEIPFDWEV